MARLVPLQRQLHPFLALLISLPVFFLGLLFLSPTSISLGFGIYTGGIFLCYLIFGYVRVWWRITWMGVPLVAIPALLAALGGATGTQVLVHIERTYLFLMAAVLTLSVDPVSLLRAFNQCGVPRMISIGFLIPLRFMRVLKDEISRVRFGMRTRGVHFSPKAFRLWLRAFFIPFFIRLFSLSDTLATSLEMRGFRLHGEVTSYRSIVWRRRDSWFLTSMLVWMGVCSYAVIGGILS